MPIHVVLEWTQKHWRRSGIHTFQEKGDFDASYGFVPNPQRGRLERLPDFAAHAAWPANFGAVEGWLFDRNEHYFVAVGKDTADDHLATAVYDSSFTHQATNDIVIDVSASSPLIGRHQQNLQYWGEYIWYLTGASKIYRYATYEDQPTDFWTAPAGAPAIICPYGDRMYCITNQGAIYRLNAANDDLDAYYAPPAELDIRYVAPFHQYLALVARQMDGGLNIYRLPDVSAIVLHEVAQVPWVTGHFPGGSNTPGRPFAMANDLLYMLSGYYKRTGEPELHLYAFDGVQVHYVAAIADPPAYADVETIGLLNWRNHIVYYCNGQLKILVGNNLVDWYTCSLHDTPSSYVGWYCLADEMILVKKSSGGDEGFIRTSGLTESPYIETSWLDIERPGTSKFLHRISFSLAGQTAVPAWTISYKLDNDSAWTTAASSQTDAHYASDPIKKAFYRCKVKISLSDATDVDTAITAISLSYSLMP